MMGNTARLLFVSLFLGFVVSTPGSWAADNTEATFTLPASSGKLWTAILPELDAGRQSISSLAEKSGSNYILVNFWASWCIPCRKEMPMLQEFANDRAADGFLVVGVAIDDEEKARPVVETLEITYPILLADFDGVELMNVSGNELGLLPYSLLLSSSGEILENKLGEIHEADLETWSNR